MTHGEGGGIIIIGSANRTKKQNGGEKMGFAYNKLKGKIKEVYGTQEAFAIAMGMGRTTLHSKLHNITEFTQSEMLRALELLHLEKADIDIYFFKIGRAHV